MLKKGSYTSIFLKTFLITIIVQSLSLIMVLAFIYPLFSILILYSLVLLLIDLSGLLRFELKSSYHAVIASVHRLIKFE